MDTIRPSRREKFWSFQYNVEETFSVARAREAYTSYQLKTLIFTALLFADFVNTY